MKRASFVVTLLLAASVAACGVVVSFGDYNTTDPGASIAPLFAVNGTVDGLGTAQATLVVNGANPVDVHDGPFVVPNVVADGAPYAITVQTAPAWHTCVVTNGTGTIAGADATGVVVHCPALPTHPPLSLRAPDQNPNQLNYQGAVTIGKAADESDVTTYELYWATTSLAIVSKITSLPKTGADLTFALSVPLGTFPPTATRLVAFTKNAAGEMAAGVSTAPSDNYPLFADISAGQRLSGGATFSSVIDTVNAKLLVVGEGVENSHKASLHRCNLDGSACTYTDISAGQGANSGETPSAVVDTVNGKLLVVTNNGATGSKASLFRCNLDGTACTHTDISAGQSSLSGATPSAVIDTTNGKLLVVTNDGANGHRPSLFRCNLDGTGCTHTDLSGGAVGVYGNDPFAVIDGKNGKLLVATGAGTKHPLIRSNLDGSGATVLDYDPGESTVYEDTPRVALDPAQGKLIVVANRSSGQGGGVPDFLRCNLDATGCVHVQTSTGIARSPVIDVVNDTLLVGTLGTKALTRCKSDGTSCKDWDVPGGTGANNGQTLIDTANGKLLIVTDGLGLFTLDLW